MEQVSGLLLGLDIDSGKEIKQQGYGIVNYSISSNIGFTMIVGKELEAWLGSEEAQKSSKLSSDSLLSELAHSPLIEKISLDLDSIRNPTEENVSRIIRKYLDDINWINEIFDTISKYLARDNFTLPPLTQLSSLQHLGLLILTHKYVVISIGRTSNHDIEKKGRILIHYLDPF